MSASLPPPDLSPPQREAVEAAAGVFVDAGAGSGKTTVLVERYLRSLLERNHLPSQVLAVTFTRRAAGELRERVRKRLRHERRDDLIPLVEGGWIGTIHAACQRILAEYSDQAGLPARLRVADEVEAILLREAAFDRALAATVHELGDDGLRLVATYGPGSLREVATALLAGARLRGRPVEAPPGDGDPTRLTALIAEVREGAVEVAGDQGTSADAEKRRRAAADLIDLLDADPEPFALTDLSDAKRGSAGYKDLIGELERTARGVIAAELAAPLQHLLDRFAAEYDRGKADAACVDQDDLLVRTLTLLREREDVRADLQERFRDVMVDEFQDTDALQEEILRLLCAPSTPFLAVGDEKQAIYGFRGAEVEVFRGVRERARGATDVAVVALEENRRSLPPILAAINAVFAREQRFAHQALRPVLADEGDPDDARVELLVGVGGNVGEGREAEAALVARRLRDLVDAGECAEGDIAIVFRAGTNAGVFEDALRAEGLATVSSTGRGFLEGQPVNDVLAMLRVLWNRYDDHALLTCLASPLSGVSNDGLALMRAAIDRWEFVGALDDLGAVGLRDDDLARAIALRDAIARLRPQAGRLGLADLIAEVISATRYDLALLVQRDGLERMANVEKLRRVAQAYEDARGADLPGFITAIESGSLDRELRIEGVIASEDADAVRLMTVHQAKGLEFGVVVVADTAWRPQADTPAALVPPRGAPAAVVPTCTGERGATAALEELIAADREAAELEGHRVMYVACTRAERRLIVSGARGATASSGSTLAWVLGLLDDDCAVGDRVLDVDGARIGVRVAEVPDPPARRAVVRDATEEYVLDDGEPQLTMDIEAAGTAEPTSDFGLASLAPLPTGEAWEPPYLSYSALELLESCAYRFQVERLLGLPAGQARGGAAVGKAVHAAIEAGDGADVVALLRLEEPVPEPGDEVAARAALARWEASPLAARLAPLPAVRHEEPFLLRLGEAIVTGRFDLAAIDGDRLVIGDLKVASLDGLTAEERRDRGYRVQEAVYALAALEAGHVEVEVAYQWIGDDASAAAMAARVFTQADRERLRAELEEDAHRAAHGPWPATPPAYGCAECPAYRVLCAGDGR